MKLILIAVLSFGLVACAKKVTSTSSSGTDINVTVNNDGYSQSCTYTVTH